MRFRGFVAEAVELSRLPVVQIEMTGDENCRELYSYFTRRHARWRLIENKRWGVALLLLPEVFVDYPGIAGPYMRRKVNRATRAGFTVTHVDALTRLDEVLAVNRSAEERQGRPMDPDYLNEEAVRRYFERASDVYGVIDATGVLRAYISLRTCGEVTVLDRLLGHAEALDQGVMYLLVMETIRELIGRRQMDGRPKWFMYDMFSGGSPGLRQFKHRIGCKPYRVSWSWRDRPRV